MLPTLTVNRSFMQAFIAAETPCCALGLVEESGRPCGLIALRPDKEIPAAITDGGFNFGHSLLGTAAFEVIHFAFEFYGFATYNVLINPNNVLVQAVLERMIDDGDYFFFSLEASGRVTAFRAAIGQETLSGIKANRFRMRQSTTTETEYRQALSAFAAKPEPEGTLLHWVCRGSRIDLVTATCRPAMALQRAVRTGVKARRVTPARVIRKGHLKRRRFMAHTKKAAIPWGGTAALRAWRGEGMACRRRRLPEANQAGDPAIYKAAARESTMRVTHARYDNNDTPALARQP